MFALSLDIGTSCRKAAIFARDGEMLACVRSDVTPHEDDDGNLWYDPEALTGAIFGMIHELPEKLRRGVEIIGITGMAEGGLLIDACGQPLCDAMPWNTPLSRKVYEAYLHGATEARFLKTGLHASYKHSVFKVLALEPQNDAMWLGLPEYVAFRFCGVRRTVPSLAARTNACDVHSGAWDTAFMSSLGLCERVFASIVPEGLPIGGLLPGAAVLTGLPEGTPVTICGHDHLCALYGTGVNNIKEVLISAGTAQAVLGILDSLEGMDPGSGLSYGPYIQPCRWVWMGGLQAAGGSINWIRDLLYPQGGNDEILKEADSLPDVPGEPLFFPFLNGRNARKPKPAGAFFGLSSLHKRGALLQAVYEGLAYETRSLLASCPVKPEKLVVTGGLSRHTKYMQILSNVMGLELSVCQQTESVLRGSALLALGVTAQKGARITYSPGKEAVHRFDEAYLQRYLPMRRKVFEHDDT